MHLSLNLINMTNDIQENWIIVKIYIESKWRVILFWQSCVQRGQHTKLCIILLNELSKHVTWTRATRTEPAGFGCFSGFYRVRVGSGLRGEVSKPGGKTR